MKTVLKVAACVAVCVRCSWLMPNRKQKYPCYSLTWNIFSLWTPCKVHV